MPSNKGKRTASRQTQAHQRPRRKGPPQLTEAQLRGPSEAAAQGSEAPQLALTPATPAAPATMGPRALRERQAIAIQAGPPLRSELARIGIVTFIIGAILMGLKFGTNLGA